jgi:hypothetical protein
MQAPARGGFLNYDIPITSQSFFFIFFLLLTLFKFPSFQNQWKSGAVSSVQFVSVEDKRDPWILVVPGMS